MHSKLLNCLQSSPRDDRVQPMFIGHFAAGFAAKKLAPEISLGTLFLAAQLADLIWPTLVTLGIEQVEIAPGITAVTPLDFVSYPFSHSLVALCLWSAIFAVLYGWLRRSRVAALTLALLVISHWILDFITHRPDVPVDFAASYRVGLGLWNSIPGTLALEVPLLLVGVALYARSTRARDRIGTIAFWALVVFLLAVYVGSIWGPPPPSVQALTWSAQAIWILIAWGYWIDRHRQPIRQTEPSTQYGVSPPSTLID